MKKLKIYNLTQGVLITGDFKKNTITIEMNETPPLTAGDVYYVLKEDKLKEILLYAQRFGLEEGLENCKKNNLLGSKIYKNKKEVK